MVLCGVVVLCAVVYDYQMSMEIGGRVVCGDAWCTVQGSGNCQKI